MISDRRIMYRLEVALLMLAAFVGLAVPPAVSQKSSQNSAASSSQASSSAKPTAAEIAAAKASHKVWVNLDSGIYHKGGRWYGKTKNGQFMTLDDAKKAGYKASKRD